MKCIGYLLALVLIPPAAYSQANVWNQIPDPFTGRINSSIVTTGGTILVSANGDLFSPHSYYRSTDLGKTWEGRDVVPPPPYQGETPVAQFTVRSDGSLSAVVGSILYTSTDDGLTWNEVETFPLRPTSVWFTNSGKQYLGAPGGVFESTDNGVSWNSAATTYGADRTFYPRGQLVVNPDGYMLVIADDGTIYRGRFGGGWQRAGRHGGVGVLAVSGQQVFYHAYSKNVYISVSNGMDFRRIRPLRLAKTDSIISLGPAAAGDVYIGTKAGRLFKMYHSKSGFQFQEVLRTTTPVITFSFGQGSGTLLAGTGGDGVYLSRNSSPFVPIGVPVSQVWAFAHTSMNNLFALSQYENPRIFRSTDDGLSWSTLSSLSAGDISLIGATSAGVLFAFHSSSPLIERSTDNGNTWRGINDPNFDLPHPSQAGGPPYFTSFVEGKDGTIFLGATSGPSPGGVYKSTDAGLSWSKIYPSYVGVLHETSTGVLYASTGFAIMYSTNDGTTWSPPLSVPAGSAIHSMVSNSTGTIFVTAEYGVLRSTDQGNSWQQADTTLSATGCSQLLIDSHDQLYVGTGAWRVGGWAYFPSLTSGGVFTSSDAGNSWIPMNTGLTNQNILALSLTADDHLLAAAYSGGIFTTGPVAGATSPPTQVFESERPPSEYRLEQNYPNPFNPVTVIQYQLVSDSYVRLTLFNTLGQKVATVLDNELLAEGVQESEIDASKLASGVYYYRIEAHDAATGRLMFEDSKKMLLLK